MIVKIQMPLTTNDPDPQALVYNKNQSVYLNVPVAQAEPHMKGRVKAYFHAKVEGDVVHIKQDASWQTW